MQKRNREARIASGLLDQYLRSSGLKDQMAEKEVLKHWEEIVGSGITPHVDLVDAEDGVLLLRTQSSVWKTEIYLQKKMILAKANDVMKANCFRDLRFI